jgi:hypothetical protein
MPIAEELVDEIQNAEFMSCLDINKAYHQIRVNDPNGVLTIRTRSGLYRFNVLPLGISPAVATFQSTIEALLGESLLSSKVRVFLDDIIIFSSSLEEHAETLEKVLQKLEEAGLKLKLEKCKFAVQELKFLGYILTKDGISLDQDRIQALIDAPKPKNCSDVRGLLGGLQMLRQFEPKLAEFTNVLNPLTNEYILTAREDEALKNLKELLREMSPDNWRLDPRYPLIVETDASCRAVGATLIQEVPTGEGIERRLIYAASRSFKGAETRYSTIRRELLAVVFALAKFRRFILHRQFVIRTDHRPLVGLPKNRC